MDNEEMIPLNEFCMSQKVEISFVHALSESGLVEVTTTKDTVFITRDQLPELEKLVRFHYDMDINLEGIEAIHHLLQQMNTMKQEMRALKNRLGIYEGVEW